MNPLRIAVVMLLTLAVARARAQESAASAAAATPAPTEMKKWIETTDAPWQAAYKRDVTDIYNAAAEKLKGQYPAALEGAIAQASRAKDLDSAVALRNEEKRFSETPVIPEKDAPGDAEPVKQVRATMRAQLAHLEEERVARAKVLYAKYDQALAQAQGQLTERGRLDDALLVKAKRQEVASQWGIPETPSAGTAAQGGAVVKSPGPTPGPKVPMSSPVAHPLSPSQLMAKVVNSAWRWGKSANDTDSKVTVTIYGDKTIAWSDRPSLHVHFEPKGNLTFEMKDDVWTFADDLESFTVKGKGGAEVIRWGTRVHAKP